MFHQFFRQTQDAHNIKTKDLAKAVGISADHLSRFRRRGANITLDLLWRLLNEMERMSPGAKEDFARRIASNLSEVTIYDKVAAMSPAEISETLHAIASTLRKGKDEAKSQETELDKESVKTS